MTIFGLTLTDWLLLFLATGIVIGFGYAASQDHQ